MQALRIAEEQNLDLVKISPQAKPPVCKLMNYGKFRFEQSKREKEARKNQHVVEDIGVRHLAAAETDRDLDPVAVGNELLGIPELRVEIPDVNAGRMMSIFLSPKAGK